MRTDIVTLRSDVRAATAAIYRSYKITTALKGNMRMGGVTSREALSHLAHVIAIHRGFPAFGGQVVDNSLLGIGAAGGHAQSAL